MVTRHMNQIADHCRCRRQASCPAAVIHARPEHIAYDIDRVHHAVHREKRMLFRQQIRRYPHGKGIPRAAADRQKLYCPPELFRIGKIRRCNVRYPFHRNILIVHLRLRDERSQYRDLARRIVPLDVCRRIRLSVAIRLRLL